jgi:CheY-like chemotaxis protein
LQQAWFAYDLVITDLMMPRMDGIELLTNIRAYCPWIRVVLITGRRDHEVASRAQMLGAFAVLAKPCGIEELNGTIKLALLK